MAEPIHIISLGAGVQSSCVALGAALGEFKPMPKAAIFADTQAEPKSVYTWLDWLEKQLPFPVIRVTKGNLELDALSVKLSKGGKEYTDVSIPLFTLNNQNQIAAAFRRQCTEDYKIDLIKKKCRELGEIKRGQKSIGVIQWIGISLDEISRMKDSREPWIKNHWPLVDARMNRNDCLRWMQVNGFPKPPRSACVFCAFHGDHEWRRLKTDEPEEFERAVKFEKDYQSASKFDSIPFLHRSCKPLSEVDFSTEEERGQLNMFNNECEGMCGV